MKTTVNPLHGLLPMHFSPRCKAKSKRSGVQCKSPAVSGWKVCRMHGAGGGAPKGKANGKYRHGLRTAEAAEERRNARQLIRAVRALCDGAE